MGSIGWAGRQGKAGLKKGGVRARHQSQCKSMGLEPELDSISHPTLQCRFCESPSK